MVRDRLHMEASRAGAPDPGRQAEAGEGQGTMTPADFRRRQAQLRLQFELGELGVPEYHLLVRGLEVAYREEAPKRRAASAVHLQRSPHGGHPDQRAQGR